MEKAWGDIDQWDPPSSYLAKAEDQPRLARTLIAVATERYIVGTVVPRITLMMLVPSPSLSP